MRSYEMLGAVGLCATLLIWSQIEFSVGIFLL